MEDAFNLYDTENANVHISIEKSKEKDDFMYNNGHPLGRWFWAVYEKAVGA